MPEGNPLSYEDVCRYVGRLYLESQHEIDRLVASQGSPVLETMRTNLLAAERRVAELEAQLEAQKESGA